MFLRDGNNVNKEYAGLYSKEEKKKTSILFLMSSVKHVKILREKFELTI